MAHVAVVVVHGVADQERASSARSVADLLGADAASYSSFVEVPLRIARERMEPGAAPKPDPGLEYMYGQLEEYRKNDASAGAVYDTVRLEGTRTAPNPATVHVHEVYWADLSRAGSTWYRLLAEFYQLILHLPSLGRNALRCAKQVDKRMSPAYWLQFAAVWLLTVPIPLINLVMLSLGIVALSAELPASAQLPVLGLGAAGIAAAIATLLFTKILPRRVRWILTPIVSVAAGAATAFALRDAALYKWIAVLAAIVAAALCIFIARKYNEMKRGAFLFGIAASLTMAAVAIAQIRAAANAEIAIYQAAVSAAVTLQPYIAYSWFALFVLATLAAVVGLITARDRSSRRAAWTARFSLALPAILFAIFTLAIWLVVTQAVAYMSESDALGASMERQLMQSAYGLELLVGALAIFLIAAVWVAGPSIVCEIRNPKDDPEHSTALGKWISAGLGAVGVTANVLTLALAAMIVAAATSFTIFEQDVTKTLLYGTAGFVVALVASKYLSGPFRATVDILLDVDNYMRESPHKAAPRARIAERFVSMLRHLCNWRDANGKGYDKIVIIAHSQGTVIAADALRYLKEVPDPSIAPINSGAIHLSLFTMGSPLKQLYAFAFPHLYDWIENPATVPGTARPFIGATAAPVPQAVLAQVWANAYRTGDYVGRHLWLDESYARLWVRPHDTPAPDFADDGGPARVQFCVGAGAHTHYWNASGGDVGRYLDQMI